MSFTLLICLHIQINTVGKTELRMLRTKLEQERDQPKEEVCLACKYDTTINSFDIYVAVKFYFSYVFGCGNV